MWHAGTKAAIVQESLEACGLFVRTQIIWAKQHFVIGRGHYHVQHEPCWYAVRKTGTGHWSGDRTQSTLWQIKNAGAMGGTRDDATSGLTGWGAHRRAAERRGRPGADPGPVCYDSGGTHPTVIDASCSAICRRICSTARSPSTPKPPAGRSRQASPSRCGSGSKTRRAASSPLPTTT